VPRRRSAPTTSSGSCAATAAAPSGFASRNFYVSFLAALDIDRNPEKYFGALQKQSEARFQEVQLPAYVPMATLERRPEDRPRRGCAR